MNKNNQKYLARIMVEAATPMRIGSGNAGLLIDQLVVRDANGLPYIPGASLAGVIRHSLDNMDDFKPQINQLFGFQKDKITDKDKEEDKGQGSRIVFSPALMVAENGIKVHEGLEGIPFEKEYYQHYQDDFLPERDHVKIDHRGVATMHAKYEEQVVFKGTRFVFEMELTGTANDAPTWKAMLDLLCQPTFRVGAGTRKGLGDLAVIQMQQATFDLSNKDKLKAYLNISSSLNIPFAPWEKVEEVKLDNSWTAYQLELSPENFFLFGSGLQDADADETPKTEKTVCYKDGKAIVKEEQLLIPATSIKGTLSHRVAFHYNLLTKNTIKQAGRNDWGKADLSSNLETAMAAIDFGIDPANLQYAADSDEWQQLIAQLEQTIATEDQGWKNFADAATQKQNTANDLQQGTGELNDAVVALFGRKAEKEEQQGLAPPKNIGQKGKVIFSDIFVAKDAKNEKVLNHVAIDRFTGGGIDGALFQEKVTTSDAFSTTIYVDTSAFKEEFDKDKNIQKAFENALTDLVEGRLPLGGHTTKGHGIFTGKFIAI